MAKGTSKADVVQIARKIYDEEKGTLSVELEGMEVAIELNHKDGDSTYSIPKMEVILAEAGQLIDTSEAKMINILNKPEGLELSCVIERFVLPVTIADGPQAICLPNIKPNQECIIILQS